MYKTWKLKNIFCWQWEYGDEKSLWKCFQSLCRNNYRKKSLYVIFIDETNHKKIQIYEWDWVYMYREKNTIYNYILKEENQFEHKK